MRSLLAPLLIGLTLSLAAMFGVQWTMVRMAIDKLMQDYVAGELAQDADELFSALSVAPGGRASLLLQHFDPSFLAAGSGRYYQIMADGTGPLRSPSLAGASLAVAPPGQGRRHVSEVAGPNGQVLLLSASGYESQGRSITIAVGADMRPITREFGFLAERIAQVSLLMFGLLLVLQTMIVRLTLRPLRRTRDDLVRLEHGEIAQLSERVPVEVLPLVHEVNRLLTLMAQRLQRSRESLGNLAHALKAPLTVLTHIADDEHVRNHPELGPQVAEQLALLRRRIDSELRRARFAGGRASGMPIELKTEVEALVHALRNLHRERALDIDCRVDADAHFLGDREDLLELCGNLIDNACKWARSRILISARHGDSIFLTVEDDGPGCTPEDLKRIARRGVRLDETTEGHGLGLSIAAGIVASYGATMVFGRSQALGGFEVRVALPGR